MDKGAGLSVGGISKIASSNKKITLRDCILECDFFAVCGCLCGQKAFPLIDQSVGKLFSVCSLPLSESIGNLLLPFCNTQILRRHKQRIDLNAICRNIQFPKNSLGSWLLNKPIPEHPFLRRCLESPTLFLISTKSRQLRSVQPFSNRISQ